MAIYSVLHETCVHLILSAEDRKNLATETRAALVQFGRCSVCRARLTETALKCSASPEGHKHIWLSNEDWEKFEDFVYLENARDINRNRAERRADAMQLVPGFHTPADITALLSAQRRECYYCGKPLVASNKRRDHMSPVAHGGSEWPSNIALTCVECNLTKSSSGAVAFWNLLRRRHGAAWVTRRKSACKEVDSLKRKLTTQRKAELKGYCVELAHKLNAGLTELRSSGDVKKAEYADIDVRQSKDGIRIDFDYIVVSFPPASHRRVKQWAASGSPEILVAVMALAAQMGLVTLKRIQAPKIRQASVLNL